MNYICKKSPFQKKQIANYIERQNIGFKQDAERFFEIFLKYLENKGCDLDYAINAYVKLCNDVLTEEMKFRKTGKYSVDDINYVISKVYNNAEYMKAYMYGLLISQFLWENHYKIYKFFNNYLKEKKGIKKYLEIGPGHGLFLSSAIKRFPESSFTAVDLSSTSLDISQSFINFVFSNPLNISFEKANIFDWEIEKHFDFVVMGEVLEHVENPINLLKRIKELLTPDGEVFITTCANCPAIDHIYLFNNVDEIREIIKESGFEIKSELVLSKGNIPESEWNCSKTTINYATVLSRVNTING